MISITAILLFVAFVCILIAVAKKEQGNLDCEFVASSWVQFAIIVLLVGILLK